MLILIYLLIYNFLLNFTKVELNGEIIKGVTKLEIKNDYTPNSTKESVIVEISNISSLEIMEEK